MKYICLVINGLFFAACFWHAIGIIEGDKAIVLILKGKNMGITISFIFCLLSGFLAFWLFWKCVDWFEKI
ncbi:MAG: hypothetical protein LUE99_09040 [Bacteroides sp.]|nr:hypothetical protein [Bacteroides sp.]